MVVTLAGFMGSGKSSVGRELATLLGCPFSDLDEYIVHKAGESIPDIFKDSEDRFRALEAEALRDLVIMSEVRGEDAVIALGGGTVLNPELRILLENRTKEVYLRTEASTIRERLEADGAGRPLFDASSVESMLEERKPLYERAAIVVSTDEKTPLQIAREIKDIL